MCDTEETRIYASFVLNSSVYNLKIKSGQGFAGLLVDDN